MVCISRSSHIHALTTSISSNSSKSLVEIATKLLQKAREDEAEIEEIYQKQLRAYRRYHKRYPADEELIDADMALMPESFHEHMQDLNCAMDVLESGWAPAETASDSGESDAEIKLASARGP